MSSVKEEDATLNVVASVACITDIQDEEEDRAR